MIPRMLEPEHVSRAGVEQGHYVCSIEFRQLLYILAAVAALYSRH
jgi:hypothetical protein